MDSVLTVRRLWNENRKGGPSPSHRRAPARTSRPCAPLSEPRGGRSESRGRGHCSRGDGRPRGRQQRDPTENRETRNGKRVLEVKTQDSLGARLEFSTATPSFRAGTVPTTESTAPRPGPSPRLHPLGVSGRCHFPVVLGAPSSELPHSPAGVPTGSRTGGSPQCGAMGRPGSP